MTLPKEIPPSITGWMFPLELEWLYLMAKASGGPILEVGSYKGLSASALGQAGPLTCVDTFQGGEDLPVEDSLPAFAKAMQTMGLSPRVIVGRSEVVLPALYAAAEKFSFILIDGSHQYADTLRDIRNAWALLGKRGVLVVDDFYGFPDIQRACHDSGWWFDPVYPGVSKMAVAFK